MSNRIIEGYRFDSPLVGQTLNNTNVTGRYIDFNRARRAMFILSVGAMAATKTCKLEIMQGKTVAGGSGEAITATTATITANTKVKKATVALASVGAGDTVTVTTYLNGVLDDTATFTKGTTVAASGTYADAAGLVLCIAYALPSSVISTASTTNVLITAYDNYVITVTSADVGGTVTVATNEAIVAVEVSGTDVDSTDDFRYLAPKVTSTATGTVQVTCILEQKDLPVGQGDVGASYPA